MGFMDSVFLKYRAITDGLLDFPRRAKFAFPGATVTDDPVNDVTSVTFAGGGSGTQYTLTGPSLVAGDWVCLVAGSTNHLLITKATPTAIAAAGVALGMVLQVYVTGATDVVVANGGTVQNSITTLGNSTDGLPHEVYINASARSAYLYRPNGGEYIGGKSAPNGRLVIATLATIVTSPLHVFNAVAYGCDPTNTIDSAPAFNALFALIAQAQPLAGGVCFAPKGQYRCDSAIGPVPQGCTFEGEHDGSGVGGGGETDGAVLNFYSAGKGLLVNYDTTTNVSTNVKVRNLRIRGQHAGGYWVGGYVKHSGSTGPDITIGVVPTAAGSKSQRSWRVKITVPGARGTAQFQWSTDGGSTWNGSDIATAATVTIANTGGLTFTFATGTYVVETYAEWVGNNTDINTVGISCVGGARMLVENCSVTGFKHLMRIDGAEGVTVRAMNFQDSGPGGQNGYYPEQSTPLGDDSAFALVIGTFDYTVPGATNGGSVSDCQFNNTYYGMWCVDGVAWAVRDCTFECTGAMGRIVGMSSVQFSNCLSGDPQLESGFTLSNEVTSAANYALQWYGCDFATHSQAQPALLIALPPGGSGGVGNIYGITFQGNNCTNVDVAGAIRGSHYINSDGDAMAGNYLQSGAALCDAPFTPISGVPGTPVNHRMLPSAALDIMQMDPTKPVYQTENTLRQVYEEVWWRDQYDTFDEGRWTLSAATHDVGNLGFRAKYSARNATNDGGQTVTGPAIPGSTEKSGVATFLITAHLSTTETKTYYWKVSYEWTLASGGTLTLGASPFDFESNKYDANVNDPSFGTNGTNSFTTAIDSNTTQPISYSIDVEVRGNGR
jgi:hypothetical protein